MKFFSKNANLAIVLKQGLPGNAQLGTTSTPGLYARFKDGMLELEDEKSIELMMKHPGYNVDFIRLEEEAADPYAGQRAPTEPTHIISNMVNGHPERMTKTPMSMTPEVKQALMEAAKEMAKPMAIELAKAMLPSMMEEAMNAMRGEVSVSTEGTEAKVPAKRGRKPKAQDTESTVE